MRPTAEGLSRERSALLDADERKAATGNKSLLDSNIYFYVTGGKLYGR